MALLVRRVVQLYTGLALYGLGIALQVASSLGNDPWDVFHQGLTRRFGLSIGTWILIVGVLAMLLWIPLRQRPGVGTISNALLVGLFADVFLAVAQGPVGFNKLQVIKRLRPNLAEEPEFLAMFLDEARISAALSHSPRGRRPRSRRRTTALTLAASLSRRLPWRLGILAE